MAEEEVTYDPIGANGPGPGDPLGLRKKLQAGVSVSTRGADDALGLRARLNSIKPTAQPAQAAFKLSEPTLMAVPKESVVTPSAPNEKINISQGEINYVPDEKTFEIQRQQGKAKIAHEKVNAALTSNDVQYEKKLRESRRNNYTVESLRNEYKQNGQILSPQDEQRLLQKEKERRYNLPVTKEELSDFKTGTILTPKLSRKFIKDLNDKDVAESAYQVDKFNELVNDPDPNAHKRIEKINEVAKGIRKGTYIYDPETKAVVQPMGMIGSIMEGVKNKSKADEEHDFLKNTTNDAAIIMELEGERNNPDLDQPIKVPRGKLNEALNSLAEMPITPMIAGAVGTVGGTFIGNPELGTVAATALGAYENRKAQYRSTFKQVYNEMRDLGKPEFEALNEARKQAENAQEIGTVVGAAQGYLGAKIGEIPINGTTFSVGYQKAVGQFLKNNGSELGKIALDAAAQGGLGAGGEIAKNKLAQAAGIKRDWDAGAADAFYGNAIMAGGIGAALKLGRGLSKINYKTILNGLTKSVPEEAINSTLQEKVATGEITQDAANQALNEIKEYKAKDAQIPPNVTEDARFKIQDNIDKINELEQQKEQTHKSLQGPIKENIDKLVEENLSLSKETVKSEKPASGLSKDKEKEAIDFAHELVDEGILPDTYAAEVKKDPIKFWQTIAQQAQNRDENWNPLSNHLDEQSVRDNYGDTVVDYAKELFPAPETKELNISVIQPGEMKHPETITISPRNRPNDVRSTESVSVIMPRGRESEPVTIKPEENAIPIRSSEEIHVGEAPGDSQEVGGGIPESGETPRSQETGIPKEESSTPGQEGIGEPRMVGITHAQMDMISEELGLPKYEGSPETFKEWDEQAANKLANDPSALPDLFNKLRNGVSPDPVETRMMVRYFGDLMGKIDHDPYNTELQNQVLRTKDLFNIAGRLQGKSLVARKGWVPAEPRLGDFIIQDTEANKAPLSNDQTAKAVEEYNAIKKAKDDLDAKVAKLESDNAKLKADRKIKSTKSEKSTNANKRTHDDYVKERKGIVDKMKADLLKVSKGGGGAMVSVPGAAQLMAIAPHVGRLIKSYVEEGIEKLPELVEAIHNHLKDVVPDITEKDVHDLIAGEYNKPKETKNDINEKIFNLRTEAKLVNKLEELNNGIEPKNEKAKRKRSREIEELRGQIKEHDLTKLGAYKSRLQNDISKLQEQLRRGDFSEPKKPGIKLDKEGLSLQDELIRLKQEREKRLAQLEYENRTNIQKTKDVATNILNVPRTLMASADLSAPLRQGIVATIAHPSKVLNNIRIEGGKLKAGGSLPEMFRQAFSQKQFDRWLVDLKESPEYKLMEDSGLYIADPNSLHLQVQEEQFMSNLGEKIPLIGRLVKGSERGYVAYLNKMRADLFNQGAEVFADQGKTFENSPELYKGLARFINNSTGRGGLGPLEQSAQVLNTAFFSPRLIASRLNLINPVFYTKLPREVRIMALKDMAKVVGFGASVLGLAGVAGAQVEKDPRSSDFGKIKVGNTRWDIWGGFQQYARIFAQLMSGQTKSSNTGEVYDLKGDKFPYKTRLDQLGGFFRGKLAPVPGLAIDLLAGKNVVGEEVDPVKKAYELFVPMIVQDIQDAWKEQGAKSLVTVGVPSGLGVGVTTYEQKKGKPGGSKKSVNHKKSHISHKSH